MAIDSRKFKLISNPQDEAEPIRLACKRPQCPNVVDQPTGRSRPREFCSDDCRKSYQREREQAQGTLAYAQRLATQYELNAGTAAAPARTSAAQPTDTRRLETNELALGLIADALARVRVDLQDGIQVTVEDAMTRIEEAKTKGDRLRRELST